MTTRILNYILAFIFFASGAAKLLSLPFELEAFARWGYPVEFMYFIGVAECLGAIGLLIPRLSSCAALCLAGLMLGAIATHLMHKEWPMLAVASAKTLAACWRAWTGRSEMRQLLTILRNR